MSDQDIRIRNTGWSIEITGPNGIDEIALDHHNLKMWVQHALHSHLEILCASSVQTTLQVELQDMTPKCST